MVEMVSLAGSNVTAEAGPQWMGYWKIPEPEIEIKVKMGAGQAANVFRAAWKTRDNRPVAAKIINFFSDREARVLASIHHDNIIQFFGVIVEPPKFIIVMELCDEGSLYDYVCNLDNPLDHDLRQQWAMEIAKAMRYLHFEAKYKPVAHRSLTPTSVVLARDGSKLVAKLCAFGYSKPAMQTAFTRGSFEFTVWKAPEVLRQEKPTVESDVYGYAMILWYMAARQVEPFDPLKKERAFAEILSEKRPKIPSDCPEYWPAVIEAGWKHKKEERIDFKEVVMMLEPAARADSLKLRSSLKVWEIPPRDDIKENDEGFLGANGVYSHVVKATYVGEKFAEYRNQLVAAKVLRSDSISIEALGQFMDSLLTVSSKSLVRVLGAQCFPPPPTIVMEIMQTSLQKHLKDKGALRLLHVQIVAKGIAAGLSYLHSLTPPQPHGGLSSKNVFLNNVSQKNPRKWEIKLGDYFLTALTPCGSVSAVRYAAPELKEKNNPTLESDIYSFGVLLIEMYTNTVPEDLSSREVLTDIDSEELVQLIRNCTAKSVTKRPSISEVITKLEEL